MRTSLALKVISVLLYVAGSAATVVLLAEDGLMASGAAAALGY